MTIEHVTMTDRVPVPFLTKLNPIWWLGGPDGLRAPETNNGAPYLPDVKAQWLRDFYWFWRNPCMNLVGFVLGVEDNNYTVIGTKPVLLNTWRDADPPATGWKWSVIFPRFSAPALAMSVLFGALSWSVSPWFLIAFSFSWLKILGPLPFISYNGRVEFYHGWRPSSGGFGTKFRPGSVR